MSRDDETTAILTVQKKYGDELMAKANVIGIGVGMAKVKDEMTELPALVVMVTHKIPLVALTHADVVPAWLDAVRVDVQETGTFSAQA